MVGIQIDKNQINATAGDIARQLTYACNRAKEFRRFLDQYTPQDLAQFDFTVDEANLLKSALGEINQVVAALDANRTFQNRIIGMGAL